MSLPAPGNLQFGAPYTPPDGSLDRPDLILQPPPVLPRGGGGQNGQQLLYLLLPMIGMGSMAALYFGRGAAGGNPLMWVVLGVSGLGLVATVLATLLRGSSQKKLQINEERRDYLRYLGGQRRQVRELAKQQTEAAHRRLPGPEDLWDIAATDRMWRRRRTDADFGRVRVAVGPQLLRNPLKVPESAPLEDLDPVTASSLRHFIKTYATVPDLPVAVSLRSFSTVVIRGERAGVLGLARSMVAQLASFHSPTQLRIAVCLHARRLADWDWLKWLPHSADPSRTDATGPARLVAGSLTGLAAILGHQLGERPPFGSDPTGSTAELPHLVVLLDGGDRTPHPRLDPTTGHAGVTFLDVGGPPNPPARPAPNTLQLQLADGRLGRVGPDRINHVGTPDRMDVLAAEFVARQLAALHEMVPVADDNGFTGELGLPELLGIGDPRELDTAVTWRPRPARDRLRVPIGVDPAGRPVELDLKESAENGMGPHGLVIGATGSGKSELLRTLVIGLAATHSSESLNFALVDFKGGATFAGMAGLPHVSAVITNLSDELSLVDRMGDALRGEMVRRQELLRAAGNYASVRDYQAAREAGARLAPIPSLVVIIDEFSELLASRPELTDLFVMIGRLGRSLAIHLLFASQRLEEGRLRGLDTQLSYRIGLRTFSASESRTVLGVPDAYELPPIPGSGYLKVGTGSLVRFKAAYVSGPLPERRAAAGPARPAASAAQPIRFTLAPVPVAAEPAPPPEPEPAAEQESPAAGEIVLDTLVGRLQEGPPAHQIWLPPLAEPASIDQIMPGLTETPDRGYTLADFPGNGKLVATLAIVDKPFEQRRDLLWADLSGGAGHAVVVGAPQSGKSTLLRTLIATLALTHTPAEVQFFLLDFGGGALASLAGLPHVSGSASRLDADRCRRMVAELMDLLTQRERLFAERGVESMAGFRQAPFPLPDGRMFGDVFLVVDGWLTLRQEYEPLEEAINLLAARGLGYGIHVILSANRWLEVRSSLRDLIGTQLELRLGDPADSAIDRKAAANVPVGRPGRGLTGDKLQFLTVLPRVDGRQSADDLADGVADLVKRIDAGWRGPRAPQVRLLPELLPADTLPAPVEGDYRIPLGIAETDLQPVYVDFTADPHLIAFGDVESGKSGLLRLIACGIMARYPPEQAVISVVDYRRSLLGVVDGPHLLDYCGTETAAVNAISQVEAAMRTRLPGPELTAEQLRSRSWWTGPELFLLVDDYDLVATQTGNPLAPLAQFLPQARDIGLHLVIVRRTGGASRALFEPVMQRLRDLATPGLQLSGAREEGALIGDLKPSPQPPGRGFLVTRRAGATLIQVAWSPPVDG
ncbi:MAG TPA: type VII secretion protein EccCa [Natronosporangium sp.]